jgi:short-subunit dehydrogenase
MNKKIVVAGGTGGIGKKIVRKLSLNNKMYVLARSRKKFKKLGFDSEVEFKKIDRLSFNFDFDILINCIGAGYYGKIEEIQMSKLDNSYRDNFRVPVLIISKVLRKFKKQNNGWIINVNSISGLKGFYNGALYCSFKFALRGFFEVLEKEVKRSNIRITEIFPGIVDTDMINDMPKNPRKDSLIKPEKIAEIIDNIIENNIYTRKIIISNDSIKWN